jgi:hypothetical protein
MVTPVVTAPSRTVHATARLTAMWKGGSAAGATDAAWVPGVSGALILVLGALTLATKQPILFAGIGPTALLVAGSPGHTTTRFHNIVIGHLTALGAAWLSLLLLGAMTTPTLLTGQPTPVARVWASAFAVALTALLQPTFRAYHPPAAATALLLTLGVYKATWQTSLYLMGGVLVLALLGEWFKRLRLGPPTMATGRHRARD